MRLNYSKTHLLNIKGNITASIDKHKLDQVKNQRDLGLQVSENLNWNENAPLENEKVCAFFKLKRNISQKCEQKSKLNAYLGYVVPIVTYCSQAWFPHKSQMKEIEKLRIATKWILSKKQSYKQRLVTLNMLPLSLYIEMHDLLYLIALKQGKNDVELSNLDSIQESSSRQHSRGELQIKKNRLVRSDENFFHRTKILYNLVLKVYSNFGRSLNKNSVNNFLAMFLQSVHRGKQMHLAHCMQVWILQP